MTKVWVYKVEDFMELCFALFAGEVPEDFLIVNDSAILARITADGGVKRYPGLQVIEVTEVTDGL